MASKTGTNGLIKVGANTIAELVSWTLDESTGDIDNSTLGSTSASSLPGKTSWSVSIECFWDKDDATGQGALSNGSIVTIVMQPEGDLTGDQTITGTGHVNSKSTGNSIDAMIPSSYSITGSGLLVEGTVA